MKNIKNQKGAISLFVVLAMLFFLAFMLGVFSMVTRRNASQLEAVRETAKIYSSGVDANAVYDSMIATIDSTAIPISTPEQLKKLKDITEVNTTSTANYTINGQLYTYKKYTIDNKVSYMLANDIVLSLDEEIDGKSDISIYDYMLYDKTNYNINLNNHNIYYELSDGSLWKCIFYHDIGTSTARNLFVSNDEAGKSYTSTKYSILANDIDEFEYPWSDTTNYEFLLTYNCNSQLFDSSVYQRWRQKNNPTLETVADTTDGSGNAAELENITTGLGIGNYWGGLTLATTTATYLDGSVGHNNWFFSVGTRSFHSTYGIPTSTAVGGSASECLLFVRAK